MFVIVVISNTINFPVLQFLIKYFPGCFWKARRKSSDHLPFDLKKGQQNVTFKVPCFDQRKRKGSTSSLEKSFCEVMYLQVAKKHLQTRKWAQNGEGTFSKKAVFSNSVQMFEVILFSAFEGGFK